MTLSHARTELVECLQARRGEVARNVAERLIQTEGDYSLSGDLLTTLQPVIATYVDQSLSCLFSRGGIGGPGWSTQALETIAQEIMAVEGFDLATAIDCLIITSSEVSLLALDVGGQSAAPGETTALLREVCSEQAALLRRAVATVSHAYSANLEQPEASREHRRARCIVQLLRGDTSEIGFDGLGYDLALSHIGLIAWGGNAERVTRDLATICSAELLVIRRGEHSLWVWVGTRKPLCPDAVASALRQGLPSSVRVAMGEAGMGVGGFRLSHWQAQEAFVVAGHVPAALTRYVDVALLAAALRDERLARSLVEIYLTPLGDDRSKVHALYETLRAYFAAGRNTSAAAAALKLDRRTVSYRLRKIESRLGARLHTQQPELEVALRLDEILTRTPSTVSCVRQFGKSALVDVPTLA